MMKKLVIAFCVAITVMDGWAQGNAVYLCNINGVKAYTDKPCPDGAGEKISISPQYASSKKINVEIGGFEWNILGVRRFYEIGKKGILVENPQKNHFLVIEMTVKNKKNIPNNYIDNYMQLICDGQQYLDVPAYLLKEQVGYERFNSRLIQPGATIKTYAAFDVSSSNKCNIVIFNIPSDNQVTLDIVP